MGIGKHYLSYDGYSTEDAKLYLSHSAIFGSPSRSVTRQSVPGRNGDIIFDNGRYENAKVTYSVFCNGNFRDALEWVRNVFGTHQDAYYQLEDTYNEEEFRMARFAGKIDAVAYALRTSGKCDLEFDCMPQRFLWSGKKARVFSANGEIVNPTENASNPLITVKGYGDFVVNGCNISVKNTGSDIVIDSEKKDCYFANGTNANKYVSTANYVFPFLKSGKNIITKTSSTVTSITIEPRWWVL